MENATGLAARLAEDTVGAAGRRRPWSAVRSRGSPRVSSDDTPRVAGLYEDALRLGQLSPRGEPYAARTINVSVNLQARVGTWHPAVVANFGYDPIYSETVEDESSSRLGTQWRTPQFQRRLLPALDCGVRSDRKNIGRTGPAQDGRVPVRSYAGTFLHRTAERPKDAWSHIKESGALFYVRCHNVLSDSDYGCRIYSQDAFGNPVYDWARLDRVLDIFLDAGVRPIIECDFMPDALCEGQIVRNYGGGAINLPKDFGKWKELVRRLVLHCERRYGQEEVRKWYFEVWNEPDVEKYWVGATPPLTYEKIVQFLKLYDYFAAGAKEADPEVRVGGPALGGCNIDYGFARYFMLHCVRGENFATGRKEGAPIDFISWHAYGDLDYIVGVNERYRRIIRKEAPSLSKCELHLNEWGQPLGKGGNWPWTQNHYEAAFTCSLLGEVLDKEAARVDLMLRWGGLGGEYFSGWRSLFTRMEGRTLPLAIFNLYRLLGKMSREPVKVTVSLVGAPGRGAATPAAKKDRGRPPTGAIATSASANTLQLLLWRFDEKNYSSVGAEEKFTVTVRGFQEHVRTVRCWQYLIDAQHCDSWSEWNRMGKPKPATPEQAEAILRKGILSTAGEERSIPVRQERAIITLSLRPNSVCLLVLGKEGNAREGWGQWSSGAPESPAHHQRCLRKSSPKLAAANLRWL